MKWPLEEGARRDLGHADSVRTEAQPPRREEIELSIAISLKRIADGFEEVRADLGAGGDRMGFIGRLAEAMAPAITEAIGAAMTAPINSYGEGIGDAIQGQIVRGQRGIDQYEGRQG